jgi:hypothetical protein
MSVYGQRFEPMKRGQPEDSKKRQAEQEPSALKHGVFSGKTILPGEDPKQFEALLKSLKNELQPLGILEEDTVRCLAEYLWRRSRLDIFKRVQQAKVMEDEKWKAITALLDTAEKHASSPRRSATASAPEKLKPEELREKILEADPQLQHAVLRLSPALNPSLVGSVDLLKKRDRAFTAVCEALGVETRKLLAAITPSEQSELALLAEVITPESFQKELAIRERLDGMIDRCIKRLFQLKAGKRMLELDSPPKTLPKPNGNGRSKLRSV